MEANFLGLGLVTLLILLQVGGEAVHSPFMRIGTPNCNQGLVRMILKGEQSQEVTGFTGRMQNTLPHPWEAAAPVQ